MDGLSDYYYKCFKEEKELTLSKEEFVQQENRKEEILDKTLKSCEGVNVSDAIQNIAEAAVALYELEKGE